LPKRSKEISPLRLRIKTKDSFYLPTISSVFQILMVGTLEKTSELKIAFFEGEKLSKISQ